MLIPLGHRTQYAHGLTRSGFDYNYYDLCGTLPPIPFILYPFTAFLSFYIYSLRTGVL